MAEVHRLSLEDRKQSGVCQDCGEEYKKLKTHQAKSSCTNPDRMDAEDFALFSGGHDSLVSTHYCMEELGVDAVLHIDTNTGVPETQEYVVEVCQENDWDLYIRTTSMDLETFGKKWGFPKASTHSWAYRWFKDRVLDSVASDSKSSKPEFYTGVRKDESRRRMKTVSTEDKDAGDWIWKSPIAEWTEEDCENYMEEHDLSRNPVVDNIHQSGECLCGAFNKRDETLIDLQANYPEQYEWLMEVEQEVQEEIGRDEEYCWWGSEGVSSEQLQCLIEEADHESDMVLCQDCEINADGALDF